MSYEPLDYATPANPPPRKKLSRVEKWILIILALIAIAAIVFVVLTIEYLSRVGVGRD